MLTREDKAGLKKKKKKNPVGPHGLKRTHCALYVSFSTKNTLTFILHSGNKREGKGGGDGQGDGSSEKIQQNHFAIKIKQMILTQHRTPCHGK